MAKSLAELMDEVFERRENLVEAVDGRARVKIRDIRVVETRFGKRVVMTVEHKGKEYDFWLNATNLKRLKEKFETVEELIGQTITVKKAIAVVRGEERETLLVA